MHDYKRKNMMCSNNLPSFVHLTFEMHHDKSINYRKLIYEFLQYSLGLQLSRILMDKIKQETHIGCLLSHFNPTRYYQGKARMKGGGRRDGNDWRRAFWTARLLIGICFIFYDGVAKKSKEY